MKNTLLVSIPFVLLMSALSISHTAIAQAPAVSMSMTEGWKPLFNGTSLEGWRTYQNKPANSWKVKEGMLYNIGNGDAQTKHADLITEKAYENFELSVEWKIAPKANSGILYMVSEEFPAAYTSGPEYQLIDDTGYPGKLEDWQKTGANYAMNVPALNATNPAGEWNHTKIRIFNGQVEHWLNGKKVVAYTLWSDAWQQQKATGKWKDHKEYGLTKKGHIAFQDHGGEVWFREIKIREL